MLVILSVILISFVSVSNALFCPEQDCPLPRDCKDWLDLGVRKSCIYPIYPEDEDTPVKVYCDMETAGGGWTVIQRRFDGSVDFYRNWHDYENGFGNVSGEYWLGLKYIHQLTSNCQSTLRVELEDFDEDRRHAEYSRFRVGSPYTSYRLLVSGYSGSAGDGLITDPWYGNRHNGMKFSTYDHKNDNAPSYVKPCAQDYKGGWWYNWCMQANINGPYSQTPIISHWLGVVWFDWRGSRYSLKGTEMKIRCN